MSPEVAAAAPAWEMRGLLAVLLIAVTVADWRFSLAWWASSLLFFAAISGTLLYGWARAEQRVRNGWDPE